MILTKIILTNIGLFSGTQTIVLTPIDDTKPVILFGGLNGAGKTTILEAIQVALYGKRAFLFQEAQQKYQNYLKSAIHSNILENNTTSVSVEFNTRERNRDVTYFVSREWSCNDRETVTEKLSVSTNGNFNQLVTDMWDDYVEQILPARIASLFFFDGEQVEKYAKSGNASLVLKVGLNALLNMDLIDKIIADIAVVKRNQSKYLKSSSNDMQLADLKNHIVEFERNKQALFQEKASLSSKALMLEKELSKVQFDLENNGGILFEQKEKLLVEKKDLEREVEKITDFIRDLLAQSLPLNLLKPLLRQALSQANLENKSTLNKAINEKLLERDHDFIKFAKSIVDQGSLLALSEYLSHDLAARRSEDAKNYYINMDSNKTAELCFLLETILPNETETAFSCTEKLKYSLTFLTEINRKLDMMPDEDQVHDFLLRRDRLSKDLSQSQKKIELISEELSTQEFHIKRYQAKLEKLLLEHASSDVEALEARRIVEYSQPIIEKMTLFKEKLSLNYIESLEAKILQAFTVLCRKECFLSKIIINHKSLELNLIDVNSNEVYPEKLSAGERQLLVISILWGLSLVSGRQVPVIIDTPLARLDSKHRGKLVENYFTKASNQVILFSTDEEITSSWHKKLFPFVSREYLLDHDPQSLSTTVREGYFWSMK